MAKYTIDPNNKCAILDNGRHFEQMSCEMNAEDYCRLLNLERNKKIVTRDSLIMKKAHVSFLFEQIKTRHEFQNKDEIAMIKDIYSKDLK